MLREGAFRAQNLGICFKRLLRRHFLRKRFFTQVKLFHNTLENKKKEFQRSIAKSLKEVKMCEKHKKAIRKNKYKSLSKIQCRI